jgi:hypothetical protein
MSDTPRTDAELLILGMVPIEFARELEMELRCAIQALRLAKEEIEFDAQHSVVSATGEHRVVSEALDAINVVLNRETAQKKPRG